jgi:hypothetical protein
MPHDDVDQQIRINELREAVREAAGGEMFTSGEDNLSPAIAEQFWRNVLAIEKAPLTTNIRQLERIGIELPPPDELNDRQLHAKLWEVIHGLAKLRIFLSSTDHLSDRQLYGLLWSDLLRDEVEDIPIDAGLTCHLDILGGYSEEDLQLRLKYYADDFERECWQAEYPEEVLPAHVDPPYDRDSKLPSY